MFFSMSAVLKKLWSSWKDVPHHGILVHLLCKHLIHFDQCFVSFSISQLMCFHSFRLTHNWWHVALCYLEGDAPKQRVLEVYDNYIWKELNKTDAVRAEVCDMINFITSSLSFSSFMSWILTSSEYRFT